MSDKQRLPQRGRASLGRHITEDRFRPISDIRDSGLSGSFRRKQSSELMHAGRQAQPWNRPFGVIMDTLKLDDAHLVVVTCPVSPRH